MKLLLFTASIFVFCCSPTTSTSDEDPLQQIQQEMEQLKRSNEESIATMKQTYDEKIASLEQELSLQRTLDPQSVTSVAFSTRLLEDTPTSDSPIVFGTMDLNIGDGYDEFTGGFQPPVNGVYQLTFYGMCYSSESGRILIKRNDDILCQAYLWEFFNTGTCTAIAELTVGDSVRVTGDSADPSVMRGASYSGFTGFLIYES